MGSFNAKFIPNSDEIEYFGLVLLKANKIRIVNVNPQIIRIIRESLNRHDLIQSESSHDATTYDFTLHGSPFCKGGHHTEAQVIRGFFCDLFSCCFNQGWETVVSSDMTQKLSKSTIIFKRRYPAANEETSRFVCISPSYENKMLLINVPKEFASYLVDKVASLWDIEEHHKTASTPTVVSYCLKMKGSPWSQCSGESATKLRVLLLNIFRFMRLQKYKFKINVNIKGTADTLFYQYDDRLEASPEDLFIMYLSKDDRIRLLDSPEYVIDVIRDVIKACWTEGLQEERVHKGADEFILKDFPWYAIGTRATEARYLMSNLICCLRSKGWELAAALDISRCPQEKSVFVLRQGPPLCLPWMCLSFDESNKIRYMSQGDFDHRSTIERHLHSTTAGPELVKSEGKCGRSYQWEVIGFPFDGHHMHELNSREAQVVILHVLLNILRDLDRSGWTLVASADISSRHECLGGDDYPCDAHTWFFLRHASEASEDEQLPSYESLRTLQVSEYSEKS